MNWILTVMAWLGDLVALVTGLALLKDTFVDRAARYRMADILRVAWLQLRTGDHRPDMDALRPALRFIIKATVLVLIVASAGVCLVLPDTSSGYEALLRAALAVHMATQVPCPWVRWILVGDTRAKTNDPPGVERRSQERHVH